MAQIETMMKNNLFYHLKNMNFSCPAVIVGIQELEDGFVDVQPVVNKLYNTGDVEEYDIIKRVPVIFPSTKNITISWPLDQGDGVLLEFTDKDIEAYKNGTKEIHDPQSFSILDLGNAVAHVGFNPYQESPLNSNNYTNEFDHKALNFVQNKKTENEIKLSFNTDGSVSLICPAETTIKADSVILDTPRIDARNAIIETNGDMVVKGISFYEFATTHVHGGVMSGGSQTSPPVPKG